MQKYKMGIILYELTVEKRVGDQITAEALK